jgi:hypothetical protein
MHNVEREAAMAMPWGQAVEADRLQWAAVPLESVGPLKFGMSHEQVIQAVSGSMISFALRRPGSVVSAEFRLPSARFSIRSYMLSAYYDKESLLSAVAVNARNGPQVTLDGMRLVGRVPSELDDEFLEYLGSFEESANYNQHGNLSSDRLGLVLRAQRVDDVVLSRPVFVSSDWADRCGDVSEGPIPEAEWTRLLT